MYLGLAEQLSRMDDIRANGIISRWSNKNKFLNLSKEQYTIEWTTLKQKAQTSAWVQGHEQKQL